RREDGVSPVPALRRFGVRIDPPSRTGFESIQPCSTACLNVRFRTARVAFAIPVPARYERPLVPARLCTSARHAATSAGRTSVTAMDAMLVLRTWPSATAYRATEDGASSPVRAADSS